MKKNSKNKGFTLIELLIVMGILAILAGIVIIAVNPARQFAMANNSQRSANITTILNAVSQNIIENRGTWTCAAGALPSTLTNMADDGYDICACLVPTYVAEMPTDPTAGSYVDCADYDTGYSISQDSLTGRVTVSAPAAQSENGDPPNLAITR